MLVGKVGNYIQTKIVHSDHPAREAETELYKRIAQETIGSAYIEEDPSVSECLSDLVPTAAGTLEYFQDLFPSASWIRRYNLHWLLGDAIAGVTVGLVVVPQAMAYASLARLSPAYGLYTTFTGACLYWIFGTSKDIVIGATAVGSLLIGQVISRIEEERPGVYEPQVVAHAISFLCGLILMFLGFCRLGWLIEFIPYPPINAFITAASITIISTQLPTCLGIKGINTREAPYKVYVNTLKGFPNAQLDAAIGISSIILLFAIQKFCSKMEARQSKKKQVWGMLSSLRLTFTVLMYTFISWLVHRTVAEGHEKFRIVGHIEKGFSHAAVPKMDTELWSLLVGELPAILIILIVEHIAIAKNFGREYGYTVIPSQEILAQGFANLLSPFVGGYVCTGSFGASAVLTKAGVKTPLAGLFSAIVLILALYVLTSVFYYIPNAALAGLIIHATWNLVTPPHKLYKFWQYSPFEFFIWVIGVVLAIFTNLETSIYVGIALSFALLLIRMARTPATLQGRIKIRHIVRSPKSASPSIPAETSDSLPSPCAPEKDIYLPLPTPSHGLTAHNPSLKIEPPPPGIFVYRFPHALNYTNISHQTSHLLSHIYAHTQPPATSSIIPPHHHLWSHAPVSKFKDSETKPSLRAIVLDFSTTDMIDVTTVQGLVDMREELRKYAAPGVVRWYFVGVGNRWTRRALDRAGFGRPESRMEMRLNRYEVGEVDVEGGEGRRGSETTLGEERCEELEKGVGGRTEAIFGVDRPFFCVEVGEAVDAAVEHAKREDGSRRERGIAASATSASNGLQ